MYDYYFTFRSITGAQRAEKVLYGSGIRVKLLRSPKFLSIKGCGYALKVRGGEFVTVANLLHRAGVPYGSLYRVGPEGTGEELPV